MKVLDLITLLLFATKTKPQGNSEKFWRLIAKFAQSKVKDLYLQRVHHDSQCERCKSWASEVDGLAEVKDFNQVSYITVCKKCGHETYWDVRSGIVSVQIPTLPDMNERKTETAHIVYRHLAVENDGD